jgi:hypothetical protein
MARATAYDGGVHKLLLAGSVLMVACDGTETPVVNGPHDLYQVTGEHIPVTSQQGLAYGFHDASFGDGKWPMNQLGTAFTLVAQHGLGDPQASTDDALAMHALALTLDVQRGAQVAGVTGYVGDAGAFDPTSAPRDPVVGTVDGDLVSAGPGDIDVSIAPFGTAVPITLHAARVQLIAGPDELQAIISGAVEPAFVNDQLVRSWKTLLDQLVARDCETRTPPGCDCANGSQGALALGLFDVDHDCVVDIDDILENPLVQSVTTPDVTIDGQQMLSFGFGVDAAFVRRVD